MYGSDRVIPALLSDAEQIELNMRMNPWTSIAGTAEWYDEKRKLVIEILNREGRT